MTSTHSAASRFLQTVTRVSPSIDAATGTFKVTIEILDPARRIKPGMFARISIVYDKHENVLQVPRSAIVDEMSTTSVFVVEDDVAIRRPVQTGLAANGLIEITSGLDDKDHVITVGQVGLKPDARVTVINARRIASESRPTARKKTKVSPKVTD